jgi:hypothetical protein
VGAEVAAGDETAVGVGVASGFAVTAGFGFATALVGSLPIVGVFRDAGGSELTVATVMSRPALSMATQAVADTPTTANTHIAAMAAAERMLVTMSSLCHLFVIIFVTFSSTTNDTIASHHIA